MSSQNYWIDSNTIYNGSNYWIGNKPLTNYDDYLIKSYDPVTIDFKYDDRTFEQEEDEFMAAMKMNIGGNGETTCHLCGAKVVKEHYTKILTVEEDEKGKFDDVWIYDRSREFECGTIVSQHDEDKPKVKVGKSCIQFDQA